MARVDCTHPLHIFIKVLLNGIELNGIIAVNAEEGWLERYVMEGDKIKITNGDFVTERIENLKGLKVVIPAHKELMEKHGSKPLHK